MHHFRTAYAAHNKFFVEGELQVQPGGRTPPRLNLDPAWGVS